MHLPESTNDNITYLFIKFRMSPRDMNGKYTSDGFRISQQFIGNGRVSLVEVSSAVKSTKATLLLAITHGRRTMCILQRVDTC